MVAPVAAPLLGALILQWSGWRASFWLLLFFALVIFVAAHRIVPDSLSANKWTTLSFKSIAASYATLFGNKPFMLYSLAGALLFGALFVYISISPFILISKFGFTSIQFSLILGGNALLVIVVGALNIRLLSSRGPRGLLLSGLGVQSLAGLALCLLSFASSGAWPFVAILACYIGATGLIFGNLAALTMARGGPQAGIASAFMGASQYAGGALVGLIAGWIGTTAAVLAIVLIVCAVASLALCVIASRIR
jgi:DHA1 family bicyclomycin/chloramphenicol resistance-like MFS transporter